MKRLLILVYFLCGCSHSAAPRERKCVEKRIRMDVLVDTLPDSLKAEAGKWKVTMKVC